jgi:AcrR family transcriptional regulator
LVNQLRGEETRNTILEVALGLFSQHGYDATSVDQICQGAGVSKGAFYHHFSTKQDLFLALMEAWLASVEGSFTGSGEMGEDVPQMLKQMAAMSGSLFNALEGGFPILLEFWTQASRHPVIWKKAVAPYQRYLEYFTGLIQTGVDQGAFASAIDPEAAARLLTAAVMGLLLQATFDPDSADWEDVTLFGITTLVKGLRREK